MKWNDQLKAALAKKQGVPMPKEIYVPREIKYITPGTHVASDGKPYTVTYEC